MDDYLVDLNKKNNNTSKINGIKITKRNYNLDYWENNGIEKRIKNIKLLWDLNGLDFPNLEKIQ